jgi:regulator of CtrA degradation
MWQHMSSAGRIGGTHVFKEVTAALGSDDRIEAFASSDVFEKMFHEGMDLVSETATYLDGEGRAESRALDRSAALSYASESMRLTTRLMQASSWLLVQRAVREGEMTPAQARDPKYRLGARRICSSEGELSDQLPVRLVVLLQRSARLYERVDRLDASMYQGDGQQEPRNPVSDQLERLQAALSAGFGG